jgi:hypothetical protein
VPRNPRLVDVVPTIFELALENLGLPSKEVAMVGDDPSKTWAERRPRVSAASLSRPDGTIRVQNRLSDQTSSWKAWRSRRKLWISRVARVLSSAGFYWLTLWLHRASASNVLAESTPLQATSQKVILCRDGRTHTHKADEVLLQGRLSFQVRSRGPGVRTQRARAGSGRRLPERYGDP